MKKDFIAATNVNTSLEHQAEGVERWRSSAGTRNTLKYQDKEEVGEKEYSQDEIT